MPQLSLEGGAFVQRMTDRVDVIRGLVNEMWDDLNTWNQKDLFNLLEDEDIIADYPQTNKGEVVEMVNLYKVILSAMFSAAPNPIPSPTRNEINTVYSVILAMRK
jgi:hypothetical protein